MKRLALLLVVLALPALADPPTLDPGLGTLHWKVSTKNAQAQAYFDQGMRYLYAFNHEQAVRSFEYAAQLDPDLAMAYWGKALALGPNINMDVDPDREKQAYDAVQAAMAHEKNASAKESALIAALETRYSNDPHADLKKMSRDYSDAMGDVYKHNPTDNDIGTLYAESLMDLRPWKFWSSSGKPAEETEEIVRVLRGVLQRDPNHLGANHYFIHAVEASPHPEDAVAAAHRLPKLAPSAGHLVHMPAHVLQRTGDYAGAAHANEKAADVDRAFIKKNGANNMYAMMYYSHNLQFGAASHAMQGRYADAMTMADELAKNVEPMLKEMPPLEVAAAYPITIRTRFGRWNDILKSKPVDAGPLSTTLWYLAHGSALAHFGDVLGAESDRKALEQSRAKIADDNGIMQNSAKKIGDLAAQVLDARIALAAGRTDEGIAALRKAVEMEDALDYDEPADWWLPTRETLGAALLRAGRAREAETVFRDDLARNRRNPRSLYGLAAALKAQKKSSAKAMAEFRSVWKGDTLTLAEY